MSKSRSKTAETILAGLSEADWQAKVIDTARVYGWHVHHTRTVQIRPGVFATPIQGHRGLPDLVLAKKGRVLLVELKTQAGKPTLDQQAWLKAAGLNGRLWRPSDWPEVLMTLASAGEVAA